MREIKFRAWVKKEKEMTKVLALETRDYATLNVLYNDNSKCTLGMFAVEIMQYTGLKDKNGKEIYEGDILLNVNENGVFLQEIGFGDSEREYTEFLNGFKIVNGYALEHDVTFSKLKEFTKNIVLKNNIPYENDGIDDFLYDGWWVIGNIYEHPELLEDNND